MKKLAVLVSLVALVVMATMAMAAETWTVTEENCFIASQSAQDLITFADYLDTNNTEAGGQMLRDGRIIPLSPGSTFSLNKDDGRYVSGVCTIDGRSGTFLVFGARKCAQRR